MPRLDLDDRPAARFHRAAYAFALSAYAELGPRAFSACGVMQRPKDGETDDRLRALAAAEPLPREMMASRVPDDLLTLLFATGGVAFPSEVLAAFLDGARRAEGRAETLTYTDGLWRAVDAGGRVLGEAPVCVVAAGLAAPRLAGAEGVELRASRGQVTTATLDPPVPDWAIAAGRYAAPLPGRRAVFGATYDPWAEDAPVAARPEDDAANLAALARYDPRRARRVIRDSVSGRASLRATTPDRLPVAGPVVDGDAFRARFAGLAHGRADAGPEPAAVRPGLYVLTGLGSRGFSWGPLLGEAVASDALGEPGALERGAREAVHPARGLVRALKRGGLR
jgi:tRNA 5-methylaminomethyl-2-thiouridine biosynthesis bifunctional protein